MLAYVWRYRSTRRATTGRSPAAAWLALLRRCAHITPDMLSAKMTAKPEWIGRPVVSPCRNLPRVERELERACKSASDASERGYLASDASDARLEGYSYGNWLANSHDS